MLKLVCLAAICVVASLLSPAFAAVPVSGGDGMAQEISAVILAAAAALLSAVVAFVAGRWAAFKEHAARTPGKRDDLVVKFGEDIANAILRAKQEPPETPLGIGADGQATQPVPLSVDDPQSRPPHRG